MAEERKNERAKRTPQEFAFDFNSGAAYASLTRDILGGMGLVFNKSRDLSNEPIIQRIMAGATTYVDAENKYNDKMNEWENSKDRDEKNKPEKDMDPQMAYARAQYGELANSSQVRTELFYDSCNELTVKQLKGATLYGRTEKDIPKEIAEMLNSNKDKKIGDIEDGTLKKALEAVKRYHVLGNTAQKVQGVNLKRTLEGLANSQ